MQVHDLALARDMSRQPKLEMLRYVPHLLAIVGRHIKGKVPSLLMVTSRMFTWIEQSPDPFSQKMISHCIKQRNVWLCKRRSTLRSISKNSYVLTLNPLNSRCMQTDLSRYARGVLTVMIIVTIFTQSRADFVKP